MSQTHVIIGVKEVTHNPVNTDENWEEVVDFTKIKKGGIHIDDILSRL